MYIEWIQYIPVILSVKTTKICIVDGLHLFNSFHV